MKPFNLADAKAGHPVQTRDGQPAAILKFGARNCSKYNHFGVATLLNLEEVPAQWNDDGKAWSGGDEDLVMAPIGTIDNKPVYPGDMISVRGGEPFPAPYGPGAPMVEWDRASWPVVRPVTQMTLGELHAAETSVPGVRSSVYAVANAAIAHGIEHGYLIDVAVINPLEQLVGGANPAETVSIAMAYLDGAVSQERLRAIFVAGITRGYKDGADHRVRGPDEIDQLIAQVK